ncbi:MAG: protein-disulfide reductase DsbD family protein [Niabella sp.]
MKKKCTLIIALIVAVTNFISAQVMNPVKWSFSKKKLNDTSYELELKATIQHGWHIYSQTTPEGGPLPTTITLGKNPLIKPEGKPREDGKLEQKHEEVFGVDVKQFSGVVTFVQLVTVKPGIKTKVSGKISFMACNDTECLPPKEVPFTIDMP